MRNLAGIVLALSLLSAPLAAEIAEPHYVLYGRVAVGGNPAPTGALISLQVAGETLATYALGSDPALGQLYALRVPLDTVGARLPGHARTGDAAQVFVDGALAAVLAIGEAGATLALDLDPALLAAGIVAGDVSVFEGASGTLTVQVPITLTQTVPSAVEVDFITRNGTAIAGSDYNSRLGRATIPAGQLGTTVAITVRGDTTIEPDEDFFLDLSNPLGGVLLDPEGRVVILDDDTPPAFSIGDVTVHEPNPGATREATFEVLLSRVWTTNVSVSYSAFSPPGGAVNGTDYVLDPGVLTIPAGDVTGQIAVTILGDLLDEDDELFEVRLASPVGGTLGDATGVGKITDHVRILRWMELHGDEAGVSGTAQGLGGAFDVALSPDGQNLYAAGRADDSLVVFDRAEDGSLMHLATYKNGVGGVVGLNGIEAVIVSQDGGMVFAASFDDNAVASFLRMADGSLVFADADFDGVLDPESGRTVNGLAGATALAEAPGAEPSDPDHLYVAGLLDNAVAVFTIHPDGSLEYETAARDGVLGADGLAQASSIAVSDDGLSVYVTGYGDDSVALFSREPSDGFLTFQQIRVDGTGGIFGLDGALSVALSADGAHVYVAGQLSNAVAVFSRDPTSGLLSYQASVVDGIGGVDGLRQVTDLAFSHDPELGDYLYASSFGDDAVAIFERQPNGTLRYLEQERDGVSGIDGIDGATALVASADDQNVYVAGSAESKLAVFERDVVPPEIILAIFSTSHEIGVPSRLGTLSFEWAGATDQGYGVAEYWLLVDTVADTVAPVGPPSLRVPHGADPHTASLPSPGDSDNVWLHVTTCDLIGNCSPTHLGPFVIDTTTPTTPAGLASSSHATPNSDPRVRVSWSPSSDPIPPSGYASGLAGYAYAFLPSAGTTCPTALSLPTSPTDLVEFLPVGTWFFHLCAIDALGNTSPAGVLGPLVVSPDTTPPQVVGVDSVARSADAMIAPGETLDGAITQLVVELSESVVPEEAGDVASYLLLGAGADGVLDTASCAGVAGDDVALALASASYDDDAKTAVLRLPAGVSLGRGEHRVLVCSAIHDLRGNSLGGGVDHSLDFSTLGNFLLNPNFDADLAGWAISDPAAVFTGEDADDAPTSGSALTTITTQAESVAQCVDAAVIPELFDWVRLHARARITEQAATDVSVEAVLSFFDQPGCAGVQLGTASSAAIVGDTAGLWDVLTVQMQVPPGALSVRASVEAAPTDVGADSDVEVDRTVMWRPLDIFADGFESGDTSAWELQVP